MCNAAERSFWTSPDHPPDLGIEHSICSGDAIGRLGGKIAVITGANSGIGLASAKRLVKERAQVYITGRRQEELDKALQAIEAGGRRCKTKYPLREALAIIARELCNH
jgi:hypothetical protein